MIIGLDIGGTKTAVVLGDAHGVVHARDVFPTAPERGFDATFAMLTAALDRMRQTAADRGQTVDAVSVAIGGPLEIARGIIHAPPNLPGWDAVPLKSLLEAHCGCSAYVQHDGNAGALAEWYFGAARGLRNVVFITLGTGCGAGLILNGDLYAGTNDLAGEIGHLRMASAGPVGYGKAGSLEGFVSGAGLVKLAALRQPQRWSTTPPTVAELAAAARAGDADACNVFEEAGTWLGRGLAVLVDVLNPEMIVLGSLAVRLRDLLLAPALAALRQEALPAAAAACHVLPAALGERLGDIASLCAALYARGSKPRA